LFLALCNGEATFHKFIIITMILPFSHDSQICPHGVQSTASRHERAGGGFGSQDSET
jgi:hypothetical protein